MNFDLVAHLERQRAFSEKTFGPGPRTKGVLDHIRKELTELEAQPDDLYEWIDVVLLALDGAWRAGHSPQQIAIALETKQTMNEARNWPRWQEQSPDKAIEHKTEDELDAEDAGATGEWNDNQSNRQTLAVAADTNAQPHLG